MKFTGGIKLEGLNNELKYCKYCGEEILSNTRRCEFCGSLLDDQYPKNEIVFEEPVSEIVLEKSVDEIVHEKPVNDIISDKPVYEYKNVRDRAYEQSPGKNMSNWLKVFLTVITTVIPGFGQLFGAVIGIVLMNADDDKDKRSFGLAILINSVIFFIISFLLFVLIIIALNPVDYMY